MNPFFVLFGLGVVCLPVYLAKRGQAKKPFSMIVAATKNRGIGFQGTLPWKIPGDLNFFKKITTETQDPAKKNVCIMGRKTYMSIPKKFRPLPNRISVVLTRNPKEFKETAPNLIVCQSLDGALDILGGPEMRDLVENVFVIGGSEVYKEGMKHSSCDTIYYTKIHSHFECDTFFPNIDGEVWDLEKPEHSCPMLTEGEMKYQFLLFRRKNANGKSPFPSHPVAPVTTQRTPTPPLPPSSTDSTNVGNQ